MPGSRGYTSKAQVGFMHARHPDIAKRMDAETPKKAFKKLPEYAHEHERKKAKKK